MRFQHTNHVLLQHVICNPPPSTNYTPPPCPHSKTNSPASATVQLISSISCAVTALRTLVLVLGSLLRSARRRCGARLLMVPRRGGSGLSRIVWGLLLPTRGRSTGRGLLRLLVFRLWLVRDWDFGSIIVMFLDSLCLVLGAGSSTDCGFLCLPLWILDN